MARLAWIQQPALRLQTPTCIEKRTTKKLTFHHGLVPANTFQVAFSEANQPKGSTNLDVPSPLQQVAEGTMLTIDKDNVASVKDPELCTGPPKVCATAKIRGGVGISTSQLDCHVINCRRLPSSIRVS